MPSKKRKTDAKLDINDPLKKKRLRPSQQDVELSSPHEEPKLGYAGVDTDDDAPILAGLPKRNDQKSKRQKTKAGEKRKALPKPNDPQQEEESSSEDALILAVPSKRNGRGSKKKETKVGEKRKANAAPAIDVEAAQEQDRSEKPVTINKAKQVDGYYSDDEVIIIEHKIRGSNEQDIIRNLQNGKNEEGMEKAPMVKEQATIEDVGVDSDDAVVDPEFADNREQNWDGAGDFHGDDDLCDGKLDDINNKQGDSLFGAVRFSLLPLEERVQYHKLRLQQLKESAHGIMAKTKYSVIGPSPEAHKQGALWPVNKNNEVKDLAVALNIQINIVDMVEYDDEGRKPAGSIEVSNHVGRACVYMVLSKGQYNPLLKNKPNIQGDTSKRTKENFEWLINTGRLRGLDDHPKIRNLYYRQLDEAEHNNNCFYFALAECLSDSNVSDAAGGEYTADSLKDVMTEVYKNLADDRTIAWLESISDESVVRIKGNNLVLSYEVDNLERSVGILNHDQESRRQEAKAVEKRKVDDTSETNDLQKEKRLKTSRESTINEDKGKRPEAVLEQDKSERSVTINKVRQVEGYYSDDDVTILLDALLKGNGFERLRGGDQQDIVVSTIQAGVNTRTMVLAPIAEGSEEAIAGLIRDIVRAHNHDIEQILVPVNMLGIHWYTIQLLMLQSPDGYSLEARIHDSLGIRKSSVIVEKLAAGGIAINSHIEGNLPKIQSLAKNAYCGGYTARLIANLALDSGMTGEEAWGCPNNIDQVLRQEDVNTVSEHNSANAGNFGRRAVVLQEMLEAANYMSAIRSAIAEEKKLKLLQELEAGYETIPTEIRIRIKSINIPKAPAELFAIIRDLHASLPLLKVLFQTNAQGEIEKDAEGMLKLDTNIEIDHLHKIMAEFQENVSESYGVKPLNEGAAVDYLTRNGIQIGDAGIIVERISTIPQHLDIALGYLKENRGSKVTDLILSEKTIVETAIDWLAAGHPDEWTLLQHLAWLDPKFTLEWLLLDIVNDQDKLGKAIETLERLTFVSVVHREDIRGIAIASEVQEQIAKYATDNLAVSKTTSKLLVDLLELINDQLPKVTDKLNKNWAKAYVTAVEAIFAHSVNRKMPIPETKEFASLNAKLGMIYEIILEDAKKSLVYKIRVLEINLNLYEDEPSHPNIIEALKAAGRAHHKLGDIKGALGRFEKVLEVEESIHGKDHPDVANTLCYLGKLYHEFGDNKKALDFFEKSLNINLNLYEDEPDHPNIIEVLKAAGRAHLKIRDIKGALGRFEKALESEKSIHGKDHPGVANTLYSLGQLYHAFGDNKKALGSFEESLNIRKKLYTGNHPHIAVSLYSVGAAYDRLGDVRKGLGFKKDALAMRQVLYKGNNPGVALFLYTVGLTYQKLGDVKNSLDYYEPALAMVRALYQGNHPGVALFFYTAGVAYQSLGDVKKGLDYQERALVMRQALYQGNNHYIAESLHGVGEVYEQSGDVKKSLDYYYEPALTMRQALYQGNHPTVAESLHAVGDAYQSLGDVKKGLAYQEKALVMRQALYQGNHPDVAESLHALGDAHKKLEDNDKALDHYEQALKMRRALYKDAHPDIAMSLNDAGLVYLKSGDNRKAFDYLKEALEMRQSLYKGDNLDVADSLNNIGLVHKKLGDYWQAFVYLKQALEMYEVLYPGNHPAVAASLNWVGDARKALGYSSMKFGYRNTLLEDMRESLKYYERSLWMRQALHVGDHQDVATSLDNVGSAYQAVVNIRKDANTYPYNAGKGLEYHKKALKMRKALYKEYSHNVDSAKGYHPDVAISFNNIGCAYRALWSGYQKLDYLKDSLKNLKRSLKMRRALYPGNHYDVADSFNNVGMAYQALGNIPKWLGYHKRALKMKKALYKDEHLAVAASLNNVGAAYHALGNVEEAIKYYEQALKMKRAIYHPGYSELNPGHSDVANSLTNVGLAYQASGDVDKGIEHLEQALKMRKALYKEYRHNDGPTKGYHPEVAVSLNNVGDAYQASGNVKKGLSYYQQALSMWQYLYKDDNHAIVTCFTKVGFAHESLGNNGKALYHYEQALEMSKALSQGDHPDGVQSLKDVGDACQRLGDDQKALDYYKQALEMSKALYEGAHPDVVCSLKDVGYAYYNLGDYSQSLDYYTQALEMSRALYKGDHHDVASSLQSVGNAHYNLGDYSKYYAYSDSADKMIQALKENEEFKGQGTLSYPVDGKLEYYNRGLDQVLGLRLNSLGSNSNSVLLRSRYFEEGSGSAEKLIKDVIASFSYGDAQMVLAPVNSHGKHWLGLLFRNLGEIVEVTYMDSEQRAMLPGLKIELENGLEINGYESRFLEARLTLQSYNNCGHEVIENFVYCLTGARATQEGAVYIHSLLVENSLLDPKDYVLKIEENNKLIGFLSNTAPLPILSIGAPTSSKTTITHLSHITKEDGLPRIQWSPRNNEVQINLLPAIKQFNRLWAKWLQDKLRKVNAVLHKTTMGFKGLDFAVDSARLLHKPNPENAKRVVLDASYLYSLYSGVNSYSAIVSGVEVAYQLQLGEYRKAFNTGASTLSAMALPYMLAMGNRPYLGFAYVMWVAASTAYSSVMNAYSFVLELSEAKATLESTESYKELVEWLAASPLQAVYDFGAQATEYRLQINDMLFESDKAAVKAQLQGEFGQKVFDYVYLPALTENYALMKNLIRGALTEDEVKASQAKQVTITHGSLQYDLCLEVKDLQRVEDGSEHYYCYNLEEQILDKVAVAGVSLEVIERL